MSTANACCGGFGLYRGETFFGLISSDGRLYLNTDAVTREEYVAQGMGPFRANERLTLKSNYEAPADVLEDPERLAEWAEKAVEIQWSEGYKSARPRNPKRKKKKSR